MVPVSPLSMIGYVLQVGLLSLTSLCHSNGHIETMPAREINPFIVLSPNLRRGLKQNFVAKSGILGFLILFGRFLYEEKY